MQGCKYVKRWKKTQKPGSEMVCKCKGTRKPQDNPAHTSPATMDQWIQWLPWWDGGLRRRGFVSPPYPNRDSWSSLWVCVLKPSQLHQVSAKEIVWAGMSLSCLHVSLSIPFFSGPVLKMWWDLIFFESTNCDPECNDIDPNNNQQLPPPILGTESLESEFCCLVCRKRTGSVEGLHCY